MQFIGLVSILFGIIVIAFPQLIAYLIGFFFLIVGINILLAGWMIRNKTGNTSSWKVGGYEIIRNKK